MKWGSFCVSFFFLFITQAGASVLTERPDWAGYFEGFPAATIVLYDKAADTYLVFNPEQSQKQLSPCSTFKIYNSLAGLESGVLDQDDAKTLMKWDGTPHPMFPAWDQDQTLASATRNSVVWYFQALAARIGAERMQSFLDKINYGNRDISAGLTTFWLRSSVTISAREQVDLLHKLDAGQLSIAPENVAVVKKNITLSDDQGVRFMGKTGSGLENGKWILGWFVGSVEKEGKKYFFATNIEASDGAKGPKAREITTMILKNLKIL